HVGLGGLELDVAAERALGVVPRGEHAARDALPRDVGAGEARLDVLGRLAVDDVGTAVRGDVALVAVRPHVHDTAADRALDVARGRAGVVAGEDRVADRGRVDGE